MFFLNLILFKINFNTTFVSVWLEFLHLQGRSAEYFNTTFVSVRHDKVHFLTEDYKDFNTTFVSVRLKKQRWILTKRIYFNTTFVSVRLFKGFKAIYCNKKFQYNICFGSTEIDRLFDHKVLTFQYNICFGSTQWTNYKCL